MARCRPREEETRERSAVSNCQRQGPLQVRRDGIPQDGLLGARLRAEGHRHHRLLPGHAAGGRRPDRGLGGGGRQILDRDLDRGLDRPAHGYRKVSREVLPGRPRPGDRRPVLRLYRLRPRPLRAGLDRQPQRLDHRKRFRFQALEGAPPRGHAVSRRLREDLPGTGDRNRGRARAARQVRQAAPRRDGQAEARTVRTQLRPRRLRSAERGARLHQGRREHQLAALHALARPLPLLHGGGQQGRGGERRGQGHLPQRHRRNHGGHVRARRVREGPWLLHRHDRPRDRLYRDPVDGEVGAQERHDPASPSRRAFDLYAAEDARRVVPRHRQMDAACGRRPHPRRDGRRQARGRSRDHQGLLRYLPRGLQSAAGSSTASSSTSPGRRSTS